MDQYTPPDITDEPATTNDYTILDDHIEVYVDKDDEIHKACCSIEDEPLLIHATWRLNAGGYLASRIHGRDVLFHKAVMVAEDGETIDHINRDRLDNRRENLRSRNPRIQGLNRIAKPDKVLPPGVTYNEQSRAYVATWSKPDGSRTSRNFSVYMYGDRRALKMAMAMRLIKMFEGDDYLDAVFPEEKVEMAVTSIGGKYVGDKRAGIAWLSSNDYNVWSIPYDGKFAPLAETTDWTEEDYRTNIMSRLKRSFDWISRYYTENDLLDKYDELYTTVCDVCDRIAPGEIDVIVPDSETGKLNVASLVETVRSDTAQEITGRIELLRSKAVTENKLEEFTKVMANAYSRADKIVRAREIAQTAIPRQPRKYKSDPYDSVRTWAEQYLEKKEASVVSSAEAFAHYSKWFFTRSNIHGQANGPVNFNRFMKELGYETCSRRVYPDLLLKGLE